MRNPDSSDSSGGGRGERGQRPPSVPAREPAERASTAPGAGAALVGGTVGGVAAVLGVLSGATGHDPRSGGHRWRGLARQDADQRRGPHGGVLPGEGALEVDRQAGQVERAGRWRWSLGAAARSSRLVSAPCSRLLRRG